MLNDINTFTYRTSPLPGNFRYYKCLKFQYTIKLVMEILRRLPLISFVYYVQYNTIVCSVNKFKKRKKLLNHSIL